MLCSVVFELSHQAVRDARTEGWTCSWCHRRQVMKTNLAAAHPITAQIVAII